MLLLFWRYPCCPPVCQLLLVTLKKKQLSHFKFRFGEKHYTVINPCTIYILSTKWINQLADLTLISAAWNSIMYTTHSTNYFTTADLQIPVMQHINLSFCHGGVLVNVVEVSARVKWCPRNYNIIYSHFWDTENQNLQELTVGAKSFSIRNAIKLIAFNATNEIWKMSKF